MTVQELIDRLKQLPPQAELARPGCKSVRVHCTGVGRYIPINRRRSLERDWVTEKVYIWVDPVRS
jgi:hypothetical protein